MRKNCTPGEAVKSFKIMKSEAWDDPEIAVLDERRGPLPEFPIDAFHPGGGIYCCALLRVLVLQPVTSRSRCSASHQV
jgi:hypothetical protein